MRSAINYLLILSVAIGLFSCKGDDGPPGPQGEQGEQGPEGKQGPQGESYDPDKIWLEKEGSVTADITGTTEEGTDYSWEVNYQGVLSSTQNYYEVRENDVRFHIYKTYANDGEEFSRAYIELVFTVDGLNNTDNAELQNATFHAVKDMGDNQVYSATRPFFHSVVGSSYNLEITDFDETASTISGTFSLNYSPNDSKGGALAITNGNFTTEVVQVVARKAAK